MNIEQLVSKLKIDLTNEYKHWHFYMDAATLVRGLHREELREFLLKEAQGEMLHVEQFRKLIRGLMTRRGLLCEIPSKPAEFESGHSDPKAILEYALIMEDEVVANYTHRMNDAIELQENGDEDMIDGRYVEIFLEDQILESRGDADHIREMLEGWN